MPAANPDGGYRSAWAHPTLAKDFPWRRPVETSHECLNSLKENGAEQNWIENMLSTIGYERSDLEDFVWTLETTEIEVLVDIRDRAQSRRKGFSKTALSTRLAESGIRYIHYRELGDPKEGREAARAGRIKDFQRIFHSVLKTKSAQDALSELEGLLAENLNICLLCYERSHSSCHRKIVAEELQLRTGVRLRHLGVQTGESVREEKGRVLHHHQSAAA